MTLTWIVLWALLGQVCGTNPKVGPLERICSFEGDTTRIVIPVDDSATLEFVDGFRRLASPVPGTRLDGNRLKMAWSVPGRHDLPFRSFVGKTAHLARIEVVEKQTLELLLRPIGDRPMIRLDSSRLTLVEKELSRLFSGSGIQPKLSRAEPIRLPSSPSFWDPEGAGFLDLYRNDDPLKPTPALDSLVRWMTVRKLAFPNIVLFVAPVRVGWSLQEPITLGDSLLRLSNESTFPWRDARGATIRYTVGTPKGERLDTFQVVGYNGNTMGIRTTTKDGKWRSSHFPKSDLVLRPDQTSPAFGLSPSWCKGVAPIIVLPDGRKLEDVKQAARVIAREICHTAGVQPVDEKTNLMSSILRMDVATPTLTPEQVLQLQAGLKALLP